MNYIILNGKKSTMVKGLMIQSLPPISKPLIRTRIEEIDGRDGDIVTKLGYAAYDREMSIGLFGDYNIAEVMQYFDSEGTVIFSNELDRVYNYQILGQIDYERLGAFKQAKVKFHVQPFKYASVDDTFVYDKTSSSMSNIVTIYNDGNVFSKPHFLLEAANFTILPAHDLVIGQSISDDHVVGNKLRITSEAIGSKIEIDLESMTAIYPITHGSANRVISGDYSKMKCQSGKNYIELTVSDPYKMTITNISRWI